MKRVSSVKPALYSAFMLALGTIPASAANLIVNGDFEQGNTGFTTTYTYSPNVTAAGFYAVDDRGVDVHPGFTLNNDHTSGSGNMMIVNGNNLATVWEQTIIIPVSGEMYFSFWATSMFDGDASPADLRMSIDGVPLSDTLLLSGNRGWTQYIYAAPTTAGEHTIRIVNAQGAVAGNDFAIDDIYVAAVPEPSAALLSALGLGAVLRRRRRA